MSKKTSWLSKTRMQFVQGNGVFMEQAFLEETRLRKYEVFAGNTHTSQHTWLIKSAECHSKEFDF